jgi:trigger factor
MATYYTNLKKTSDKDGEISFQAEIPLEILEKNMGEALIREAADFTLPGFRKGKVPETIVRQHISEMDLLEDAAHAGFEDAIREIIADEKLSIIGAPQATITKIALKNPVTFTVRFALYPVFTLPDYKKIGHAIAERTETIDVTEHEVDEAITRIRKMMAPRENRGADAEQTESAGTAGADGKENKNKGNPLPPVTDDFVKQFGSFKDVAEFRAEVTHQLGHEKEMNVKESKREEIVKKIMESSKIKIPPLLIDEEFYDFTERRDGELTRAKLSLEEYLKQIKKTEKELEQEERKLIEDRIKMSVVLGEIRKKEIIEASEDEIRKYIPSLKARYPDRSDADVRQTAEAYIIQEKLFGILEGKDKEENKTE